MVHSQTLTVRTRGEADLIDLTPKVAGLVEGGKIREGIVNLFVIGSTAALTTIEFEPGLAHDFPATLERIAPKGARYLHEEKWHDDNGHSHVRASLVGPSLTVPFIDGRLVLGTWQQIVLLECDTRPRERIITVQVIGE